MVPILRSRARCTQLVARVAADIDSTGNGRIDFHQFSKWYMASEHRMKQEISARFDELDVNHDGMIDAVGGSMHPLEREHVRIEQDYHYVREEEMPSPLTVKPVAFTSNSNSFAGSRGPAHLDRPNALQARHAFEAEDWPSFWPNVPAGQSSQSSALRRPVCSDHDPEGHMSVHTALPARSLYFPTGHCSHAP